ncbi:hypothetical protein SETIT_1G100500v2 [Setaria italica]|uniref:Uncharacterized protein n=1 Tax=Setaria italica TaxID=4555 RepID=A0A368PIR0_SETIT|nr:hypothetical protein SETIT_1G100500v2 [Setaria italica]
MRSSRAAPVSWSFSSESEAPVAASRPEEKGTGRASFPLQQDKHSARGHGAAAQEDTMLKPARQGHAPATRDGRGSRPAVGSGTTPSAVGAGTLRESREWEGALGESQSNSFIDMKSITKTTACTSLQVYTQDKINVDTHNVLSSKALQTSRKKVCEFLPRELAHMKQTNSICGHWTATPRNACAGAYSCGLVANERIITAPGIIWLRHREPSVELDGRASN